MEEWLISMINKEVVLTIRGQDGSFELKAQVVGVENGLVNVRSSNGVVAAIPCSNIEDARIEF